MRMSDALDVPPSRLSFHLGSEVGGGSSRTISLSWMTDRSPTVSRQEKKASEGKWCSQMSRAAARLPSRYSEKAFFNASMEVSMLTREWGDREDVWGRF